MRRRTADLGPASSEARRRLTRSSRAARLHLGLTVASARSKSR